MSSDAHLKYNFSFDRTLSCFYFCQINVNYSYKFTHESALAYPEPKDYIDVADDMGFSKTSLRLDFPEGMYSSHQMYSEYQPAGFHPC